MLTIEEVNSWYINKEVLEPGMTESRFPHWIEHLDKYRYKIKSILEIGSCEGRSAIFWLNFFPNAKIVCVDHFKLSPEHEGGYYSLRNGLETRFDRNTEEYKDRITKIPLLSKEALPRLLNENSSFDLIYIDGSHEAGDVKLDTEYSWKLLNKNGILIWDDYQFDWNTHAAKKVIDDFIDNHKDELEVFYKAVITKEYTAQIWARRKD